MFTSKHKINDVDKQTVHLHNKLCNDSTELSKDCVVHTTSFGLVWFGLCECALHRRKMFEKTSHFCVH